jgi:hypothetical protein
MLTLLAENFVEQEGGTGKLCLLRPEHQSRIFGVLL